jgi:hypothetical protein
LQINGGSKTHRHNHRSNKSSKVKESIKVCDSQKLLDIELKSCDNSNAGNCDQPLNLSCNDNRRSFSPLNHSSYNHSSSLTTSSMKTFNHSSGESIEKSSSHSPQSQQQQQQNKSTLLIPPLSLSYSPHDDDSSTCYSFHSEPGIDKSQPHSPILLTKNPKKPKSKLRKLLNVIIFK